MRELATDIRGVDNHSEGNTIDKPSWREEDEWLLKLGPGEAVRFITAGQQQYYCRAGAFDRSSSVVYGSTR